MSDPEHERAYMPTAWSKRFAPDETLPAFFRFCQDITTEVRSNVQHELDIPYGPTDRSKYDIYGTNLPQDAPIILFFHGGYWQEFSKDLSGFAVPNFVSQGIRVVVGGYDLCPNVKLTDIVQQAKDLVEKVLALAHATGSKSVWVGGHSAGAHLTASLLHDKNWLERMIKLGYLDLLKGLVLIAGIYCLEPLLRVSVNEALDLTTDEINSYTFAPFNEDEADDKIEPIQNLKVIVAVGECDAPVFIEESRRYARRLTKLVDNVEFLLMRNDIDHFDIVENLRNSEFILSKIVVSNVKS